jgi:ABC-type transporter Mla subunit MlaD
MPDFKFPSVDLEKAATDLNNLVKEAAYVAVGLGVLGFQRAQVGRVELLKQLDAQLANLGGVGSTVEAFLASARAQLSGAVSELAKATPELPDPVAVRSQLTELARSVDEAMAPVRQQLEEQMDRLEEVLPEAGRTLVQAVRAAAATQQRAVRTGLGLE